MVKSELLRALSEKLSELQARDLELALDCILEQMANALAHGERIEIRGFGGFVIRHRSPRLVRSPKTGETFNIPAKAVVHFKPGKEMRVRVNAAYNQCAQ